jgi:RNA polymerase sigma-70 factor (ECF subfamily)
MRDLTEQEREILLLKDIQGLNFPEIAACLGIPVGTAKSRSHRARLALAERITALDPSWGEP